jgi:peptide/nickel transport system substrate-binding protein
LKKLALLFVLVVLIVAALPLANAQDEGSTLIIGTTDDIAKLDPADAYSFHDWDLLRATGDSLLGFVPGGTELEPRLAADFPTVSEDGLTYTFTLREGITFADGLALTPELYAASITRAITLQGDPYGLVSSIAKAEAGPDNTLVITLSEPSSLFLFQAAQPPLIPVHPDLYPADAINNFPELNGAPVVVGVGAYQITSYVLNEQTVLEKNPNYFGEEAGFDRIIFVYYEESAQLDLALENGEVDIAWRSNTRTEAERLSNLENVESITLPGRIQYLAFNHPSVSDANIRQGIALAINRDDIVDRALNGLATPLYSMVPPAFGGSTEAFLDLYGFGDTEAAKAAFEAAGGTAEAPLQITMWYPPDRYGGEVGPAMEIIKAQVEATGVAQVTLENAEWSTYIGAATSGEYPIYFLGWFFDFPDADNYIQPFAQCEISNGLGTFFCDENIDALIAQQRAEIGSPDRDATLAELQNAYAEAVVTLPLYFSTDTLYFYSNKVENVVIGAPLILEYRLLQPVQ